MAGYTRQSSYTDGDVIQASDSNNEFNQLVSSFSNTTGHAHDGTAAEGPVINLIGDAGNVTPLNKIQIDTVNDRLSFYIDVASVSTEQVRVEDGIVYPVTTNDVDLGTTLFMFKDGFFAGTLESVNLEVTNIKANDGTASASIADSTGVFTITSAVLTTADINGGTLDNVTIGGTTPAAATFTSMTATTADIDGGSIDGTTIGATTPAAITGTTITGTSFVTSGDMSFGDNDKAIFGAGNDVQVYHDATNSYMQNYTGNLYIQNYSDDKQIQIATDNGSGGLAAYFLANGNDGSVTLYNYGNTKLTTTSTGIDVTGTITASGSVIAEGNSFQGVSSQDSLNFGAAETPSTLQVRGDLTVDIDSNNNGTGKSFKITNNGQAQNLLLAQDNGDISFYEDTGTTAKFFWDASAESLTLGTDSGDAFNAASLLRIQGTPDVYGSIKSATTGIAGWTMGDTDDDVTAGIFYNNASDYLYLLSNNAERMRITSSGRVGIGTTSPSAVLHANGSSQGDVYFRGETGSTKGLLFSTFNVNATDHAGHNINAVSSVGEISFSTGSSERMRIDSNGNVGIGTSSPSGSKLHLNNAASSTYIRFQNTSASNIYVGADGTNLVAYNGGSERMRIDSSGNVGIGTTSPSSLLHLNSTYPKITLNDTQGVNRAFSVGTNNETFTVRNETGSTDALVIDNNNNVGIGTTDPSSLDITANDLVVGGGSGNKGITIFSGTTSTGGILFADGNDGTVAEYRGWVSYDHSTDALRFASASSERMRIDSSGNVGIGTTNPQYTLNVGGDIVADGDSNTRTIGFDFYGALKYNLHVDGTTDADKMFIRKGTTNVATFDTSGNVGIGTDSPSDLLHLRAESPTLRIENSSTSGVGAIEFWDAQAGTSQTASIRYDDSSNQFQIQGNANGTVFRTPSNTFPSTSEAMRIDSSGNLLVGKTFSGTGSAGQELRAGGYTAFTRNGANPLELKRLTSDGDLATFYKDTTKVGSIASVGGSDIKVVLSSDGDQYITGNAASNYMTFSAANAERMRIDSSGNLLVGKTSAVGASTVGAEMRPDGDLISTRSGAQPLTLNRTTSDGDIAQFRKDNTTVGSIGANGGRVYTAGPSYGAKFGNVSLDPCTSTGSTADNAYDLGGSSVRWKDLYLSGGVYLGGTGAANKLDDYEEGTFTPTLEGSTSGAFTTDVTDGIYTKVGRVVTVHVSVSATAVNTAVGSVIVGNLPFTVKSYVGGSKVEASGSVGYWSNLAAAKNNLTVFGAEATTNVEVYALGSATGSAPTQVSVADFGTTGNLLFTLTYFTDA